MRPRLLYIALLLLVSAISTLAQESAPRFRRIGTAQGLSSPNVQALLQDSRGFLWIGTDNGLNLYDGNTFTIFRFNRHEPSSICGDNIVSLAQKGNELWIGTESGVCRLDLRTQKAKRVNFNSDVKDAVTDAFKCIVFIDKTGRVWMGNSSGLGVYDSTANIFRRFIPLEEGKPVSDRISCFYEPDRPGTHEIWIGTFDGLLQLRGNNVTRYRPLGSKTLITGITAAQAGQYWVCTWGLGIGKFSPDENRFRLVQWDSIVPGKPAAGNVAGGVVTYNSKAYFTTSSGLFISTPIDKPSHLGNLQRFRHNNDDPSSLSSDQTTCVLADRDGNIWIGTNEGLSVMFRAHQRFQLIPGIEGTLTKIDFQDSSAWISSWYGKGLQQLDTNFREIKRYEHLPPQDRDPNTAQVSDVIRARDGRLWAATFDGLCVLGEKNNIRRFRHEEGKNSIASNRLNTLLEDSAGRIWIATYGAGISVYDPRSDQFTHYRSDGSDTALANDLVWSFYKDTRGITWIGTNDGLSRFDPATGKIKSFRLVRPGAHALRVGSVWSIAETKHDHCLWIATGAGLFGLINDEYWIYYSTEEGLLNRQLGGLLTDAQDNLWIASHSGLSCRRPGSSAFVHFTIEKGLPGNQKGSAFGRDSSGRIYLGTEAGLMRFHPAEFFRMAVKRPEIFITRLLIDGRERMVSENPVSFLLAHDQNDVQLEFTAPDFDAAALQRYEYKLEGSSTAWIALGNQRRLSLANLAPGEYALSVRAANSEGEWSEPATVLLNIRPPFWKTAWFITTISLLALLLLIFVVRYVSQRRLREKILRLEKEQAIERERNRISKDMHDDLGSGLTKIAILSEVVKRRLQDPAEAARQLDSISGSARELVDNLNEIIWTLNPRNDNLQSLAAYVREHAHKFFEAQDVELLFIFPENIPALSLSEEQRRSIFLVLKESYHNIAKHAHCTQVTTELQIENGRMIFIVSDNGKGIDQTQLRPFSNGLSNMRKRMESIGGIFWLQSMPGKGTQVRIEIRA